MVPSYGPATQPLRLKERRDKRETNIMLNIDRISSDTSKMRSTRKATFQKKLSIVFKEKVRPKEEVNPIIQLSL